ncbi:MAG: ribonuclease III [Candidatus Liptonbacteria bacterium CG11_big_fil_rev_8_21_14_0_20_35_14]|uniref:Ribonuclease 3 n=1 Tax=Candidatus Liptonbacteria bacterium CG11_big_fil_rev_8_21_14_0_20_35_14 TaxID=1974634 RepID=A0A2H0N795_9BACT|nr:MAG: ribonuclease III [Candidatus Liptonbacteria bacterium CG11_big_fil_rev_8_21_14_0_20_35_14]
MIDSDLSLKQLEKRISYIFLNNSLLKEALTHRSYLNENPDWAFNHNERLEFLGDAVLELGVTRNLFRDYPNDDEGKLTSIRAALVNSLMLATIADELDLERYLFLSKGESKDRGRARSFIMTNAVEALIGAIYLDRGVESAFDFIDAFVMPHLPRVLEKRLYKDAKSLLQEIIQNKNKQTPQYEVTREIGPDHDKVFVVAVFAGDNKLGEGSGPSKQEAETEAAQKALEKLQVE